jgi:UDP:flavonoid glycosyltransferase YjiC (YdhE family)
VVLVAPSTAQDRERTLLRAALAGLADAPVRVIAAWGDELPAGLDVPANAIVVPWMSYARTMPGCAAVLTHGGHGTLVRALTSGCPVVVCPAGGDMAENAARVDWARLGVRLPRRYGTPRGVRLAVERVLTRRGVRENVERVARWAAHHDGAAEATRQLERWSGARGAPRRPA